MNIRRCTPGLVRPLALALAFAGLPAVAVAAASPSTAATCATTTAHWGSLPKSVLARQGKPVTSVRAGRHACFDRIVVDLSGRPASYVVAYQPLVISSRNVIMPLRGGAKLAVTVRSETHDTSTDPKAFHPVNRRELVNVSGFSTLRQIAFVDTFNGYTLFGVGVRARLPMRAFIINGPGVRSRLVVDVAHQW